MPVRSTTILSVRHPKGVVVAGDGQVTLDATVVKHHARKVRRVFKDRIIVGFAGSGADALHLSERLEAKLERFNGNLTRAAVELARDWRTDKYLRRLDALMIAVDAANTFLLSGNGDVIEPDDGIVAIGSGGVAAQAAARALARHSSLAPRDIAREAMAIAAALCIYTNDAVTLEELTAP